MTVSEQVYKALIWCLPTQSWEKSKSLIRDVQVSLLTLLLTVKRMLCTVTHSIASCPSQPVTHDFRVCVSNSANTACKCGN